MQSSRRTFIKNSSMALAGVAFFKNDLGRFAKGKELTGIQLYSVRADMTKDPLGSLKQLASFGYKYVEHADYRNRKFYGFSASEFKKVLDDLGLKMPSGHTVMGKAHWNADKKEFTDAWKWTVEDAAICGQQFVISPWLDATLRKTEDDLKRYMEVFNKSGELCQKSGMKFGYHNHDFEFSEKFNNVTVYDIMLANTDPKLVVQQLDIGNLYNGGAKAIDVVKKWPGRFESMHVKDEILSTAPATAGGNHEKYESCVLGTGIVNVKEVIDLGRKSGGTIHFIIEQESYQGKSSMESVKENLEIMKKWGY
jgi:sugar phosphate isomerase/epimerase